MKGIGFKRTDKKIDLKAAAEFVNESIADKVDIKVPVVKVQENILTTTDNLQEIKSEINKPIKQPKKEIKKEFLLRMPQQLHRKLKIKAAQEDGNMNEMIVTAISKMYFEK